MKIVLLTLTLLSTLFSFESFNYVNKNYYITSSKELKASYFPIISPYFYEHKLNFFKSHDNLNIAYKIFLVKNAKASIVISSGRTEGMVKYQELIYDLNKNGFNVYILDHRGQGYSSRLLSDPQIGHVNKFENHVRDMHYFVSNIVKKEKKRILLAHSMGGAIASLYVEEYPKDFTALVLSSPMHQPDIIASSLTNIACDIIEKIQKDIDRYILGEKSYDDKVHLFSTNVLTHSELRFEIGKIAYDIEPKTKIGGPSVRWVAEACRASKRSVLNAGKIKIPTLLLQAQNDKVVNAEPQNEFCTANKFCVGYQIDEAYHELFIEKDTIRAKALSAVLDFISKN